MVALSFKYNGKLRFILPSSITHLQAREKSLRYRTDGLPYKHFRLFGYFKAFEFNSYETKTFRVERVEGRMEYVTI